MDNMKHECPCLEEATGFDLKIYGSDGRVLYEAGLFAADSMAFTRLETVVVSAARTLAYMHSFCMEGSAGREFFLAHLKDLERKASDFDLFVCEGRNK